MKRTKSQQKKYRSVLFCSADPIKNVGGISKYFLANSDAFMTFNFPLGYLHIPTVFRKYEDGIEIFKKEFYVYKGENSLLKNLFNYLYFLYCLLFLVPSRTYIITNAPIYCVFNNIVSFIKQHIYVLWIGDYYPEKSISIKIYNVIVDYLNKHLKYVLYISPPLDHIYRNKRKHKFSRTVSLGIEKMYDKRRKINKKIKLGFIGVIRNQQGLELAFSYLAVNKNITLEIVGDGYWLKHYKDLAKNKGILNRIKFYGRVEDVRNIFKGWDIGIALYENTPENLSTYCEPTKLKNYLSFGIPVITTATTYFSKEIHKSHAGEVVDENIESLDAAVKLIAKDYPKYQKGVEDLIKKYDYSSWYKTKFDFLT